MDALTFLGTGGGVPTVGRGYSSILLETGGRRLLLDAGEPCSTRLKTLQVPLASLDAVLLSHGHSDHVGGLPMIIQGTWLERRREPLPIYLPGELVEPLRRWLETVYLPEKILGFRLDFQAWENFSDGAARLPGGLEVSVHPTTHLDGLRALIEPGARDRFRAYSLALEWPEAGKRLVYSGDLGRPEDLDETLKKPADLLVCELTHFAAASLFDFLRGKPVRRLCLTHLGEKVSRQATEITALGRETLPDIEELSFMQDGQRIEF